MQALLDSGVSCWTERHTAMVQPGEKIMVVNECADYFSGNDFSSPRNVWFERLILGSIAEYDKHRHRKLKRETMDLFWSVLLNCRIPAEVLSTIVSLTGPIDFADLLSEDTAPPSHDGDFSSGSTIGEQVFRSLKASFGTNQESDWPEETDWTLQARGTELHSISGRILWLVEMGVPVSTDTYRFSAAIIREEGRREMSWR